VVGQPCVCEYVLVCQVERAKARDPRLARYRNEQKRQKEEAKLAKEAAKREREEARQREIEEAQRKEAERLEEEKRKVCWASSHCVDGVELGSWLAV
jgi:sRNA-binding protein